MKIVYFGYNSLSSCLSVFSKHQHDIVAIFTGNDDLYANQIINFSLQNNIPLFFEKPNIDHLAKLVNDGVECFFSAEYPWRIPLPKTLKYAINVHPTLLPYGRGATPISYSLLHSSEHSGITFHKMIKDFDKGDILLQKKISIDQNESYNTFTAKVFIEASNLLDKLLASLDNYYINALPQKNGSYWASLKKEDQTVNWNNNISDIVKLSRAFGHLGVYAEINSSSILITALEGVQLTHTYKPSTVLLNDTQQIVVAVSDGIISITKNNLFFL